MKPVRVPTALPIESVRNAVSEAARRGVAAYQCARCPACGKINGNMTAGLVKDFLNCACGYTTDLTEIGCGYTLVIDYRRDNAEKDSCNNRE